MNKFPFYKQLDSMDCGATCLRIITKYYKKNISLEDLRVKSNIGITGVSLLGISKAAEITNYHTMLLHISFDQLKNRVPLPCIVHWNQNHFIVVYKINNKKIFCSDPAIGLVNYTKKDFLSSWLKIKKGDTLEGICLALEPTPDFFTQKHETIDRSSFSFLINYIKPYISFIYQLFIGLFTSTLLLLLFPFLTQAIVDYGIFKNDIDFIYLILIAQVTLFIGMFSLEIIRSWLLLHLSTRINITLVSNFLLKLMKLPLAFFETKKVSDIMQRIEDHDRIETFLTSSALDLIFSVFQIIAFSLILFYYDITILTIFIFGSIINIFWVFFFMKKRKKIDYQKFSLSSKNKNSIIELVNGINEIKLNNVEREKRWDWEKIQAKLFSVSIKSLSLVQYQKVGARFINQIKNVLITFVSAKAVIEGDISLGMMMSIQYIVGQLNVPIGNIVKFFNSFQDAKISLERLSEIHDKEDEFKDYKLKIKEVPHFDFLEFDSLFFKYRGAGNNFVLNNINLKIWKNRTTAIVGSSGSGKTTLVKLLLGFYLPTKGGIKVGNSLLEEIEHSEWRDQCSAVLQDGYIFSNTIAVNIAMTNINIDKEKLRYSVQVANIENFIQSLPLKYNTMIGAEGLGISEGQKQRILIARTIYKNPEILIFDEATSSLDSNNEKAIMNNLYSFYKNKTVIIIAHRLSTVKNADEIIVLDNGKIVEQGNHNKLVEMRGFYYKLVKNQLELGN